MMLGWISGTWRWLSVATKRAASFYNADMPETTLTFRITPPLYRLQGAKLELADVAGFEWIRLEITLVDSGVPLTGTLSTSGSGGATVPGDNLGVLHNTRIDATIPGALADWMGTDERERRLQLSEVTNRIIDWYRVLADAPRVRRVGEDAIRWSKARDDKREGLSLLATAGGDRSTTAGDMDEALQQRLADAIQHPMPLWVALRIDARAELIAGELRVAVLLANTSMETLVNAAFRSVAVPEDVDEAFASDPPVSFWRLLKRVNTIVVSGHTNNQLTQLAEKVHRYRDELIHGSPVDPERDRVIEAIESLQELGDVLYTAVVKHLRAAETEAAE